MSSFFVLHVSCFQGGVCKHEWRWPGFALPRACFFCFVTAEKPHSEQMQLEMPNCEHFSLSIPGKTKGCFIEIAKGVWFMVEWMIYSLLSNCLNCGLIEPQWINSSLVVLCKSPVTSEVTVMPSARWLRGKPSFWIDLFCCYVSEIVCTQWATWVPHVFVLQPRASWVYWWISPCIFPSTGTLHSACIFCKLLISGTVT